MGAGVNKTQIAQVACGQNDITSPECSDVLLLALTPAAYSSNSTADTPGRRAYISPAQVHKGNFLMLIEAAYTCLMTGAV
jgi:hypothetical protein